MLKSFKEFKDYEEDAAVAQTPQEERNSYLILFLIGIFFTMGTLMLTSAVSHISVTEAQVIFGTKAFFVLIMSIGILKTKFSYLELVGICCSFLGLLIFSLPSGEYHEATKTSDLILFEYLGINIHPVAKAKAKVLSQDEGRFKIVKLTLYRSEHY